MDCKPLFQLVTEVIPYAEAIDARAQQVQAVATDCHLPSMIYDDFQLALINLPINMHIQLRAEWISSCQIPGIAYISNRNNKMISCMNNTNLIYLPQQEWKAKAVWQNHVQWFSTHGSPAVAKPQLPACPHSFGKPLVGKH